MDDRTPAEILPELYRSVLDVVAELEGAGMRREALRLRSRATAAYAGAWDRRACAVLVDVRDRGRRLVGDPAAALVDRSRPHHPLAGLLTLLAR